MFIEKLSLKDYRNIEKLNIELSENVNIFYGDNAQGKTNILESMFMCATGRSQRTHIDRELIKFGCDSAHIQMYVNKDGYNDRIDIHLKQREKKGIAINNIVIKKLGELFGTINIVLFSPEDLMLVKEGPSYRRRYLDMELCQMSKIYYSNLQRYYKVLKERNNLLKKIKDKISLKDTLDIWDSQLVDYGCKIYESRKQFIAELNEKGIEIHSKITKNSENLKIEYKPSVEPKYYESKMKNTRDKDIYYGTTAYGIHKDDMLFFINDINARDYGSQGQQRTVCLTLKLAEIELIKSKTNNSPVLLLDDVLSELDKNRQNFIINSISNIQTVITSTGNEEILNSLNKNSKIFRIKNGCIEQ
jgi:DNA replication and repair protein recF